MWAKLSKYLALDPPTDFHLGKYLGQAQSNVTPDNNIFEKQNALWKNFFADDRFFLENDASLGNRTASDTRKARAATESEVELPQSNPGFLQGPRHDLGDDGPPKASQRLNPKSELPGNPKRKSHRGNPILRIRMERKR